MSKLLKGVTQAARVPGLSEKITKVHITAFPPISSPVVPGQKPQRFFDNVREFPEEYEPWRINYWGNGYLLFAVAIGGLGNITSLLLL